MPTNNNHNPLFGRRNNNDDDDDLDKLDMEMEEEELVFENQNLEDVDLEAQAWDEYADYWPLRIKSSIRDIKIGVKPTDSVAQVKQAVLDGLRQSEENNNNASPPRQYVRLVCKGRLLAPDSAPLHSLNMVEPNDVVHAVLTDPPKRGVQAALQQGHSQRLSRRALRSAGITASGLAVRRSASEQEQDDDEDEEEEDEEEYLAGDNIDDDVRRRRTNARRHRGFDRLRSVGLRRAEIHALRAYFSRHVDRFVEQNPSAGEEEAQEITAGEESDPLLRRRLQEEAWMQSQGPLSEFRLNLPSGHALALMALLGNNGNNGNNSENNTGGDTTANPWLSTGDTAVDREALLWRAASGANTASAGGSATTTTGVNFGNDRDFICGFLLGFFVGFIMLVWVWMPTVPHKQKLGILTGITVQLALALLRPQPLDKDDEVTSPDNPAHFLRNSGYANLLDAGDGSFDAADMDDGIVLG